MAHNSGVTDDATDGRPWPIDPAGWAPDPTAVQVPDLGGLDDLARVLSEFEACTTSHSAALDVDGGATAEGKPTVVPPVQAAVAVSDEDRNRFGTLLDHAAERGLLSASEYEVRLGELADATTIDQMQQIVTELPLFTPPVGAAPSRRSSLALGPKEPGPGMSATVASRRRPVPWVIFGTLLLVIVAVLVFFVIYAEHLIHTHNAGALSAGWRLPLSALRL